MSVTALSFKWLDTLEKEFDKAFVSLDNVLNELCNQDVDFALLGKKHLSTLCSCFAQLSHKALSVFQINAKTEAELVNLRTEVVELSTENQLAEKRLHCLLLQLHNTQNSEQQTSLDELNCKTTDLKDVLKQDLVGHSLVHGSHSDSDKMILSLQNWKKLLQEENQSLRSAVSILQAEVCGARLAAKYLDKELVGRIQQLQLLSRTDMNPEVKNKLWVQLDEEILLQRHKTVIKVMRNQKPNCVTPSSNTAGTERTIQLYREVGKGLGISVTGGREHEIPVLVSELEPWCKAKDLYVGDAILRVNDTDLRNLTHKEAVKILSEQFGKLELVVKTLPQSSETDEDEDSGDFGYPFFEDIEENKERPPRTSSLTDSGCVLGKSPADHEHKSLEDAIVTNDVYGITTLQKILHNTSNIQKREDVSEGKVPPTYSSRVSVSTQTTPVKNKLFEEIPVHKKVVRTSSSKGSSNSANVINSFLSTSTVSSLQNEKSLLFSSDDGSKLKYTSSVIADGIGDAMLGTPV